MKNTANTLYLLTGAAGFLGSNICSQLLERGDKVRAFVLKNDPALKYVPAGVEIFEGDLCSAEDCEKFFDVPAGTETICIHCASMVTVNPDYNEKLIAVNVGGTENIIAAAKKSPSFRKLVYVSSTGAIPELPKGQKIREVNQFVPYDDDKVVGWYSRSKAMATQKVLDAAVEGLNACVVHPSGILGPNDHAISETTGTIIKIMNGEMPIGMGGSFNLCDVRDLAFGTIAACDKGRKGECYILGNKEVTLKEVAHMLHDACGCKQPLFYVPIAMAYRLAAQMEKRAAKTGEKPLMTNFAVYNLDRNNSFDYSKAERELGYHTRPYSETLRDEARWLVAEGKIKGNVKVVDEVAPAAPSVTEKVAGIVENRQLVRSVAAADSVERLAALVDLAGISGYKMATLEQAYQNLELSRNSAVLLDLFHDHNYYSCSRRLAEYGVETSPAEFDLINDIFAAAADDSMHYEMEDARDAAYAAEVLKAHGHYHITEDFLLTMVQYGNLLGEEGFFTEEDYKEMAGSSFEENCIRYINMLTAVGTLTGLRYDIHHSFEMPYIIGIAGCAAMIRDRFQA
ncbi:MAG: NAD-dependent epimerase/dehydratase family protein [Lachnospiraceae bacterium]|nr:NAD-dependent epimerase/dehydratase family protein [Lachnospiraceae bacterium]